MKFSDDLSIDLVHEGEDSQGFSFRIYMIHFHSCIVVQKTRNTLLGKESRDWTFHNLKDAIIKTNELKKQSEVIKKMRQMS